MEALTEQEARAIFRREFEFKKRCSGLPEYFATYDRPVDIVVNSAAAVGLLQLATVFANKPTLQIVALIFAIPLTFLVLNLERLPHFLRRRHEYMADKAGAEETSPEIMQSAIRKISAVERKYTKSRGGATIDDVADIIALPVGKLIAKIVNNCRSSYNIHADKSDTEVIAKCEGWTARAIKSTFEASKLLHPVPPEGHRLKYLKKLAAKHNINTGNPRIGSV